MSKRVTSCVVLAAVGWLIAVGAGLAALSRYAGTPAPDSAVSETWPQDTGLVREDGRNVLVMFVHPHCPCSRASIGELARLMVHVRGRVAPVVLFYRPAGGKAEWERTDLWNSAAMIPGAVVKADEEGREAARFGVAVSGHTLLYDGRGQLVFSGGITPARGHAGDNAGSGSIAAFLNAGQLLVARTPTFGCYLRHITDM